MATYKFTGTVINKETRQVIPDLTVQAWDKDDKDNDLLGEAKTDDKGHFTIEFDDADFSDQEKDLKPDIFVRIFSGEKLLHSTEANPIKDWTPQPIPLVIEVNPPTAPDDEKPFIVEGEVVKPDGTPLQNYPVQAFDKALCDWRSLGGTSTNDDGRYLISYDPAKLEQWGKHRADLKVEVRDPDTGDTVLAESALILQAKIHENVDFSIGPQPYRGPAEFKRVERALAPTLAGLSDWNCFEVGDILVLARKAKLRASLVAYYAKAQRWAAEYGVQAEISYALMRRGESTQIDALLARPLSGLWEALKQAQANNIVDLPLNEETRTELADRQQSFLNQTEHPYAKLLGTTSLTNTQHSVFTKRLTAGELSGDAFWKALETEENFSAESIDDLKNMFELQAFADDNTSLTVRLRGDMGVRTSRDLAAYSVETWRDTVLDSESVVIPDEVLAGGTPAERRSAYAQQLYRLAELRDPTASLAGQMAREPEWAQAPLLDFFSANPNFELRDRRVLNFLRERPDALDDLPDPEATRQQLMRIEQLFHLVPAEDKLVTIQPLWSADLRSATQVAYLGRNNLQQQVGASLGPKLVNQVYSKAVHVTSLALNVYLQFSPKLNNQSLPVLQVPQFSADDALPEWEELFGSPDACECSHCESVLSPAAYLVDNLAFLEKAVDAEGNNALDELIARRPDIGTLRLTCENTETPLPHIDLVIEILEVIVASADGKTLPGTAIGATTWDSDLLDAQPEHMEPAAYDVLSEAMYPFDHLPFNLWTDEGRRYLRQMGIARVDLMRAMPAQHGATLLDIATEALGMTSLERELIRQPKRRPAELVVRWGIDLGLGSLEDQLGAIQSLLKKANVDYDRLLRLLSTRYVNPERAVSVEYEGAACSLDGAVLVGEKGTALTDEPLHVFLDRVHRFLRLQRRLDCREYELDTLIHLLGVQDFNAALFIQKLADVQALRKALRLPLLELGAWWGDLDTYGFEDALPSQYEATFQDDALFPDTHSGAGPDLRNAVFALRSDRSDLKITTSTDSSLSRWLAESDGAEEPGFTLQPDYAASYVIA